MSEQTVCPHSRQAARDAFRGELEYPEIPDQLPPAGSDEAVAIEVAIKPYYYGKLGQALGLVAAEAMQELPPKHLNWRVYEPWRRLAHETRRHMVSSSEVVRNDETNNLLFGELEAIHAVKKKLRPDMYSTLSSLIDEGAGAYGDSSLLTLLHMKQSSQEIPHSSKPIDVYKKSSNQLRDLASINISQFHVVRAGLHRSRMPAQRFNQPAGILQLATSVQQITIDQIYNGLLYINNQSTGKPARTVGEIEPNGPTIGCPILLAPKLAERLWEYTVDSAVDRGLV